MDKKKLGEILKNHELWLKSGYKQGEWANLEWANLKGAHLKGANLEWANLEWANLEGANLEGANLKGVNLEGAHLEWANLKGANLEGAHLEWANLEWANLEGANLEGANLKGANLDYSTFPLWCGGLDVHIDDRIAIQLLYHLVRNVRYSDNTSAELKKICSLKSIVKKANEFHRVGECRAIE